MFKIGFLLLTSFFSFINNAPENIQNEKYLEIIEEVKEENEILNQIGNYEIYKEDEVTYLRTKDFSWNRQIPNIINYKVVIKNENCLIFYYSNEYLYLIEYSSNGNLLFDDKVLNNPIKPSFDVIYNNSIYIVGGISYYSDEDFINKKKDYLSQTDAFILKLDENYNVDELEVFGGQLNESFIKITLYNDEIYVVGKKDILTGGDFGNGGRKNNSAFVGKITKSFQLIDYKVLSSNSDIHFIDYYKDYLYLGFSDCVYKFDSFLDIINKISYQEEVIFSALTKLNKVITISNNHVALYNIYDFSKTYETENSHININTKVSLFDNIIYLKNDDGNYLYDIASFDNFNTLDIYYNDLNLNQTVYTLFGQAQMIEEIPNGFNPLVYGDYDITYKFKNTYGLEFSTSKIIKVLKEFNVSEGLIYPIGYKLKFTGIAYLNGKTILNNYAIDTEGEYTLELHGNDDSIHQIQFKVEKDQLKFEDIEIKTWDLKVLANEDFYIDFKYETSDEYKITGVIINDSEYTNIIYDKVSKTISVKMKAKEVEGIYYYYFDSINYKKEENYFSAKINKMVTVNVLKPSPILNITKTTNNTINVGVEDPLITSRYFEVKAYSSQNEIIQKYSLTNQNIILYGLSKYQNYQVTVSLIYDRGDSTYQSIELLNVNIEGEDEFDFGEIIIVQKSETLEDFKVTLNSNNNKIFKALSNNQLIYEKNDKPIINIIILSLVAFIASTFISYQVKTYLNNKKNNKEIINV